MGKSSQEGKVFKDIYVMNVGEGLTREVGHQSPD